MTQEEAKQNKTEKTNAWRKKITSNKILHGARREYRKMLMKLMLGLCAVGTEWRVSAVAERKRDFERVVASAVKRSRVVVAAALMG